MRKKKSVVEDIKNSEKTKNFEVKRRDFLKIAGTTAAVGVTAGAIHTVSATPALAAYNEPVPAPVKLAIKYHDPANPPYDTEVYADGSKQQRMPAPQNAFNNVDLQKQSFGGQYWVFPYMEKRKEKCVEGVAGFSLRDLAFGSATERSSGNPDLMDWGTGYKNMNVEAAGKWEDSPENNALSVKKFGYYVGAGAVGICEMKEQWYYTEDQGRKIIISDDYKEPELLETEAHIPKSMKYAIAITIPLDGAVSQYTPTRFGSAADNLGYSQMSEVTSKIAGFIREMGYMAIPMGNEWALSIPIAIDAGLGEAGRHGLLISPEFGSLCKVCKVITDMPLAVDKPISFGAARFCKTCKKCAIACPSKSIPMDEEPSYEVACPSNNTGMKKWFVNTWTCLEYWVQNGGGCYVCMRNCTYSKPQTWVHDVVKLTASKTGAFNSIFAKMDDAFGYGKTWESFTKADIDAWWSDPNVRMFNWNRM